MPIVPIATPLRSIGTTSMLPPADLPREFLDPLRAIGILDIDGEDDLCGPRHLGVNHVCRERIWQQSLYGMQRRLVFRSAGCKVHDTFADAGDHRGVASQKALGARGDRLEHGLHIRRRACDDLQDVGGRSLPLQRLSKLFGLAISLHRRIGNRNDPVPNNRRRRAVLGLHRFAAFGRTSPGPRLACLVAGL